MTRLKITVFIKHVVGWQERFERFADRPATLEQCGGVEERLTEPVVTIHVTNDERDRPHAPVQPIDRLEILRDKTRT